MYFKPARHCEVRSRRWPNIRHVTVPGDYLFHEAEMRLKVRMSRYQFFQINPIRVIYRYFKKYVSDIDIDNAILTSSSKTASSRTFFLRSVAQSDGTIMQMRKVITRSCALQNFLRRRKRLLAV